MVQGYSLPYGLRDVKLTAYTDVAGLVLATTSVDLPVSRTFSFTDTEDFEELRGDDKVVAQHGNGASVEWELESGGLPLDAFKVMAGGTFVDSGVTPSQRRVYTKKTTDQRPYFMVEGQVISDSGGDLHCLLPRVKATGELSGEFGDGEFFLTSAKGVGIAPLSGAFQDVIYQFIQNETVTPISATPPVAP